MEALEDNRVKIENNDYDLTPDTQSAISNQKNNVDILNDVNIINFRDVWQKTVLC